MTSPQLTAHILTLFPAAFPGTLGFSLPGQALESGRWALKTYDIRDFATDKHRSVDDSPYGGGAGMVLRADVVSRALDSLEKPGPIYYLSPRGAVFDQAQAEKMASCATLTLICGRYEGIDQRALDHHDIQELSLGDFVLAGGEVAAQAVLEAVIRLLPGVLGSAESAAQESFAEGLLEHPHYTRPAIWQGRAVPEVLTSGDHQAIASWRRSMSEQLTQARRPDLWRRYKKNEDEKD